MLRVGVALDPVAGGPVVDPLGEQTDEPRDAVVIGASIAGLTAARVLADHFQRVTVIDRDPAPHPVLFRAGVPQAPHPHILLARWQQILEQPFPGLVAALHTAGGVPWAFGPDLPFVGGGPGCGPPGRVAGKRGRGLRARGMWRPGTAPGSVDVYDGSSDCRHPVLQSSTPFGILGHESGFAPDGRTLWISTTARAGIAAIDVSNPRLPSMVWYNQTYTFHGMNFNDDGTRLYGADLGAVHGLSILDVSQIQNRDPRPVVAQGSHLTWPAVSLPKH